MIILELPRRLVVAAALVLTLGLGATVTALEHDTTPASTGTPTPTPMKGTTMATTPTTRPRSVQFNTRVTEAQRDRLEQIANERGFFGGPGLKKDEPNLSLAARWLWGQADEVMRENDVNLEWDRSGQ